jgi:hypothetical protein
MIFKTLLGPLLIQNETSEKVASSLRRNKNGQKSISLPNGLWLPLPLPQLAFQLRNKTDFDYGLSLGSTLRIYTNSMFF